VFSKPPAGTADLCKWIKTAPRIMDIEKFAREYLESHPDDISKDGLLRLGTASLEEVRRLVKASPDAPKAYAGNNLYTIVVASYEPKTKHSRIGAIGARFNPNSQTPEVTDNAFWDFQPDSRGQAFNFGLFDFVEHVYKEGRRFLKEYPDFKPDTKLVRDIATNDAIAALANLIDAAGKTTSIVPPSAGIGGSPDILLLGSEAKPKRIQWKSN
jgi:hypothetical protein